MKKGWLISVLQNFKMSCLFPNKDQTQYLVNEALKIKATGVEKAFEKEFAEMENNIQEIRDIIRNANVSSNDIRDIEMNLKQLRSVLLTGNT